MADPGTSKARPLITLTGHVTVMAALIVVVCMGTLVHSEKAEVPSSPQSSFDFNDVDADGSGCVEGPEELQNFRLQVGTILGEALRLGKIERALRAGRITHSADVNGDGRICQCDLLSILLTESTRPGIHRHAFRVYEDGSFFDDVDADHDGVLDDVTEKQALTQKLAQCVPAEQAKSVVDAMSRLAQDDGKLTKAEYMLFLQSAPHPRNLSPPHSLPRPQPGPRPPAVPHPQPQPLPQGQSPSAPQPLPQAQSPSAPQPLPQGQSPSAPQPLPQGLLRSPPHGPSAVSSQNLAASPQTAVPKAGSHTETPPDRNERLAGEPLLPQSPQPLHGTPLPSASPVHPPAQGWSHVAHFQPMKEAGQPPKVLNLAGQQVMNPPGQPKRALNPLHQSFRYVNRRQDSPAGGQRTSPFSAPAVDRLQPQPGIRLPMPVQTQNSRSLEQGSHPMLQQGPESDEVRVEQARPRNPPPQPEPQTGLSEPQPDPASPQPDQPKPEPAQPNPQPVQPQTDHAEDEGTLLDELPDPRAAHPDPSPDQPNSRADHPKPKPPSEEVREDSQNLSDQLNEVKPEAQPSHSQAQPVDESLENELQQKRN